MKILKRPKPTLAAHIILSELIFSLPLFLVFFFKKYSRGTLTLESAISLAYIWAIAGAAIALLLWYTVSSPMLKKHLNDGNHSSSKSDS